MSMRSYLNFDLLIERFQKNYRARVQHSPVGEAWEPFALPFTEAELSALLAFVGTNGRNQNTPKMFGA